MEIYHRVISFKKERRRALRGIGHENPAWIAKLLSLWQQQQQQNLFLVK